jgi:hypothetical protein
MVTIKQGTVTAIRSAQAVDRLAEGQAYGNVNGVDYLRMEDGYYVPEQVPASQFTTSHLEGWLCP